MQRFGALAVLGNFRNHERFGERRFSRHGVIRSNAAPIGEDGSPLLSRFIAALIEARSAPCCRANESAIAASDTSASMALFAWPALMKISPILPSGYCPAVTVMSVP